jgi:hypothetical protein
MEYLWKANDPQKFLAIVERFAVFATISVASIQVLLRAEGGKTFFQSYRPANKPTMLTSIHTSQNLSHHNTLTRTLLAKIGKILWVATGKKMIRCLL